MEYSCWATYYLIIVDLSLACAFTLLRCFTRIFIVRKFWVDDYLAAVVPVCIYGKVPSSSPHR